MCAFVCLCVSARAIVRAGMQTLCERASAGKTRGAVGPEDGEMEGRYAWVPCRGISSPHFGKQASNLFHSCASRELLLGLS